MSMLTFQQSIFPLTKQQILHSESTPSSPTKTKLNIRSQKLPTDFFSQTRKKLQMHDLNIAKNPKNIQWNLSKQSSIARKEEKHIDTCKTAESSRTQQLLDGVQEQSGEQLLSKLIQTTKVIKRMIRKHSLEVRQGQKLTFQLPPLKTTRNKYTS